MKPARGEVGHADGERMTRRLGEPEHLGLVRGGLGESAELGEAPDQEVAIVDRDRHGGSERLVVRVGGQRREVVGRQLDHPLVLAAEVVRLLEIGRGQEAESPVSEAPGDLQRPGAGHQRLVQLAELRVGVRHDRADPASAAVVGQCFGEGLGLAQALQHPPVLAELAQHRPQLEADLEALLERGRALRQRREHPQRLLEPAPGFRERRPRRRLESGLPEIGHRLLPHLAAEGVMGEPLDLLAEAIPVERLDRVHDPRVKIASPLLQQAAVRRPRA